MGLAETARLAVELTLGGNFQSGVGAAESSLGRLNTAASTSGARTGILSGALGVASNAAGKFGGALSHAKTQIGGLMTGPLGLIGLTGGLLSLGSLLHSGVEKAQTFGAEVRQMAAVTGLSVGTTSALAAALEHFNIPADKAIRLTGFLEKNVGNLAVADAKGAKAVAEWNKHHDKAITNAQKLALEYPKLAKFQHDWGIALTDSNGKIKDANELILTTADYFNDKSIPAQTKAAALSKLYGRSWQDLIPFLKAGRQGIADAEDEAAKLGLTLTKDNVDALAKMKTATRELGTAMGGLELQIGLALVPALTDLADSAAKFIGEHRTDIVGFLKGAVAAGKQAVGVIGQVAGSLGSAWNSIPAPLRDFLVKGLIADRTIKFLFGVSPIKVAVDLATNALGGVAKGLGSALVSAGIGHAFVQPVFVTNPGFGGGLPGLPGAAAGGAVAGGSALSVVLPFLAGGAVVAAVGMLAARAAHNSYPDMFVDPSAPSGAMGSGTPHGFRQTDRHGNPINRDTVGPAKIVERIDKLAAAEQAGHSEQVRDMATQKRAIDTAREAARDKMESMRIALASKAQATTQKVGDLQRTTAIGSSAIVNAIRANRPIVNIGVSISGDTARVTRNYQSHGTVTGGGHHTGGQQEFG